MKKIVFIVVCVVGLTCFSSCRSTSKPCGLADNSTHKTVISQSDYTAV